MNTQKAIEFLERLLTSDPYSEDIFLPIPKKYFTKINELLRKEVGYPLDRLSGNIGRELYKSLKNSKEINEIIALLQQGEKYRLIIEKIYRILNPIRAFKVITIQDRLDILHNIQQILKDEYFSKEMSKNISQKKLMSTKKAKNESN